MVEFECCAIIQNMQIPSPSDHASDSIDVKSSTSLLFIYKKCTDSVGVKDMNI